MDFNQDSAYSCIIDDLVVYADKRCYELRKIPRGRICRVVEASPPRSDGKHFEATACPITNMQRAMLTAKMLGWMSEDVTLEQCTANRPEIIEC